MSEQSTPIISPLLLPAEVDAITHIGVMTRARLEARGLFPRRVKIGQKKIAWRRSDIEAWCSDPEGWAKPNAVKDDQ
jgi:predicted DNA-binding transcriptional regulator AlpA